MKVDVFQWANNIDGKKRDLQVELFLFNKNYTPYSVRVSDALDHQFKPLFLYDVINFVTMGAGIGLTVRELEDSEGGANTLPHTPLENVGRADTLLHLIENERNDILEFSQEEHEFKRIKGVVARYTHPVDKDVKFYIVKLLKATDSISTANAWDLVAGQFLPRAADATLKVPTDNQVLVVDGSIFIFNQSKFTQLFGYDIQQIKASDEKGAAIDSHYKLSMPTTVNDFALFAREKKTNLKKLLEVNTENLIDQDTVLEIADEMQVELMTDDAGAIILFDSKDVGVFLDIINDNYLSSTTGNHYLAKSKKPLEVAG